jgi:predicted DNA-binding transcriptional regulator AlpA
MRLSMRERIRAEAEQSGLQKCEASAERQEPALAGKAANRFPGDFQEWPWEARGAKDKRCNTASRYSEMAQTKRERLKAKNGRQESDEFLTSFQVARFLGVSQWALVTWRRLGRGPQFIRLGRNAIRYPKKEFDVWLASLPRT